MIDRFDELLQPDRVHPGQQAVASVGKKIAKNHEPQEAVVAAAKWVHGELKYLPGTTGVHSSGLDALQRGQGRLSGLRAPVADAVAQHGNSRAVRVGLPASQARTQSSGRPWTGRSHAWIQAWTGGWWNYDPTNDTEITEQYVSVGVGRDYTDVSPLKGIYSGQGATDLDVVVEITRLA